MVEIKDLGIQILLGMLTIDGISMGLIQILGGIITNYFVFGIVFEFLPPILMLITIKKCKTEENKKYVILGYSIGILLGILFVNLGIFHTPYR